MFTSASHASHDSSARQPLDVPLHVGWASGQDLVAIRAIEGVSFPHPWSGETLEAWAKRRDAVILAAHLRQHVAGYVVFSRGKDSLSIHRLAVYPTCRRRGIGTMLCSLVLDKLNNRFSSCHYILAGDNLLGCKLLGGCGFTAIGIMDGGETSAGRTIDYYHFRYDLYQQVQIDDCELGGDYFWHHRDGRIWFGKFLGWQRDKIGRRSDYRLIVQDGMNKRMLLKPDSVVKVTRFKR